LLIVRESLSVPQQHKSEDFHWSTKVLPRVCDHNGFRKLLCLQLFIQNPPQWILRAWKAHQMNGNAWESPFWCIKEGFLFIKLLPLSLKGQLSVLSCLQFCNDRYDRNNQNYVRYILFITITFIYKVRFNDIYGLNWIKQVLMTFKWSLFASWRKVEKL